ncbi:MAG: DNA polymerase IV [Actinomycetota bacterium]|nr:DNA polymerase IV [Actinomycetota bacterium]
MIRYVLHIDVDEFVAAVEILRRPELRGKPVVVGGRGDPTKRGVVSTANYEARRYGIHSGMPLRTAARRCPEAVFLPVDREAYEAASQDVMKVLTEFGNELEIWGWDEAFLEVPRNPEEVARDIQVAVSEHTRLSCSIGIGDNKLRAKTATEFAKPAGIHCLTAREWFDVMGDRPTEALWGVGKKTARRLADVGIKTVRELAAADDDTLATAFGPRIGPWLAALGRGDDSSPVSGAPRRAKSRSLELTFDEDVDDTEAISAEVSRMARELAGHIERDHRRAVGVTIKLRFSPFVTKNRSVRLDGPASDAETLVAAAHLALSRFEFDRSIRLVGVKADLE